MEKAINILTKNGFQIQEQLDNTVVVNKPGIKLVVEQESKNEYFVSMYEFHNGYTNEDYYPGQTLEDLKCFE